MSFPDLTGDGKVTKKDILKGRGVEGFKKGGKVKMAEGGKASRKGAVSDEEMQRMLDKAYNDSIGPSKEEIEFAKSLRAIPGKMFRGAKKMLGFGEEDAGDGAVTETERSITVAPAKKRGGSVKC